VLTIQLSTVFPFFSFTASLLPVVSALSRFHSPVGAVGVWPDRPSGESSKDVNRAMLIVSLFLRILIEASLRVSIANDVLG
jgi:hypothetical protein